MRLSPTTAQFCARLTPLTLMVAFAIGLSGCASTSGIESKATLRDGVSLGLPAPDASAVTLNDLWWREFGDPQLNILIERALASQPSLKIVQARLVRAQAGVDVTHALSGPQVNADLEATRQLFTATGAVPPPLGGTIQETATVQLTGSWELDFFGKNRAALDAALGHAKAAQADVDAARMLLASNVARRYFSLIRLNEQLGVAHRTLAQRSQTLKLVQDRVHAGLDTRLEQRQSEGALPEARLQIETLQEQVALDSNALAALVSEPNRPLAPVQQAQAAIKSIAIPILIPSDLLGRRADIAAARWRVEAATQDLGSARAQFYPNVNLVAFAGFSSIGFDQLLAADSRQWGFGPALTLPLFDGGRLRANLRGKTADLDVAIESYNAAVIEAVREVADQLASTQAIQRQQTEQRAAQAAAENAYDIAMQRFEAGLSNYLQVLSAETAVLNQRRQGVDLAARALDTQVALIRALGGGYHAELPARTAQP